jgi:hypothetical protein
LVVSERDVFYDSCFVIDSQREGVQRDKLISICTSICIERVKMMELAVSAYWNLKLPEMRRGGKMRGGGGMIEGEGNEEEKGGGNKTVKKRWIGGLPEYH